MGRSVILRALLTAIATVSTLTGPAVGRATPQFDSQDAYQARSPVTLSPVQVSAPAEGTIVTPSTSSDVPIGWADAAALQAAKARYSVPGGSTTGSSAPAAPAAMAGGGPTNAGDGIHTAESRGRVPDPTMAVGPTQVLLAVNSAWAVYSKDATPARKILYPLADWFAPVGGGGGQAPFDPWVVYDWQSGHFLMIATDFDSGVESVFLAASLSADALGQWCLFRIDVNAPQYYPQRQWADYPKLGVDQDGIYITMNDFLQSGLPVGSSLFVLPKAQVYGCASVSATRFTALQNNDLSLAFTVQPALTLSDSVGSEFLVNGHVPLKVYPGGTAFTLWRVTGSRLDPVLERARVLAPEAYDAPPDAPQRDGDSVDTLDARLMNAAFASGLLWTTHASVSVASASGFTSEVRVYGVDVASGTVSAYHKFSALGLYYFNSSVMPDPRSGTVTVTLSRSAISEYPGVWVAQRSGLVWSKPALVRQGGVEICCRFEQDLSVRWGDYAGSSVDPSAPVTWIYNEYPRVVSVAGVDYYAATYMAAFGS